MRTVSRKMRGVIKRPRLVAWLAMWCGASLLALALDGHSFIPAGISAAVLFAVAAVR